VKASSNKLEIRGPEQARHNGSIRILPANWRESPDADIEVYTEHVDINLSIKPEDAPRLIELLSTFKRP